MDPKLESSAVPNEKVPYERWTLLDESSVHYGYLSKTGGRGIETVPEPPPHTTEGETTQSSSAPVAAIAEISSPVPPSSSSFYITTAINYTNGPGHMGHAYEAATSDVIARHQRLLFGPTSLSSTVASNPDDDPNPHTPHHAVYFVTGADEHGQKIAEAAAAQGVAPIALCDQYCTGFRVLNQRLQITNDDYIRTTSVRHKRTAQQLWRLCAKADDIYLDTYTGWYNVREETFVTETDAALADFCDAVSGVPLKRVEEESYFFRMSKYKDRLIQYIEVDNADFIQPVSHKNLILQRLKSDDLRDLSISRTTFDWGIPVPQGFNDNHVMYVWMDALSNYLTGVNALGVNDGEGDISVVIDEKDDGNISSNTKSNAHLARFWPANVHIIGKDILWFHTVIWPCLLMSAGLALPKTVFAHGFVNDKEGKKMSKSLGNVVDPHDMLDKFDVDTFRWCVFVCAFVFAGIFYFAELFDAA